MKEKYLKEVVFTLVVDFVLFATLRVHVKVVDGDPDLSFSLRQSAVFFLGHYIPLTVLKDLSLSFFIDSKPWLLLYERYEKGVNIALD